MDEVILALVRQPIKEKDDSEFTPAVLHWKINLVSHPDYGGEDG